MQRRKILQAAGQFAVATVAAPLGVASAHANRDTVIERDVCIIGGGSAGTYTAVRLRDAGRSVAVIERKSRLGGHAETHVDPATGVPTDIGVVVLENTALVSRYLARFSVPAVPAQFPPGDTRHIDLRSGRVVAGYVPPDAGAALFAYQQLLSSRYPYLDAGFLLPDPVPPELVLPFREFVRHHGLDAMVPTLFDFTQGIGNVLDQPTLYVLKLFGLGVVNAVLGFAGSGFLFLPFGTAQLYDRAAAWLGDDVLLNSDIRHVERTAAGVVVEFDTPNGRRTVRSRTLVVAIPPTLHNLSAFELDGQEAATFRRLRPHSYGTGIVRLAGLPPGVAVRNTAPDTDYNLPPLPGIYGLTPTQVPGLWNVKYGADMALPDAAIRLGIRQDIESMARAGSFPVSFEGFEVFSNHTPFQMMVSPADIAAGYYRNVESLQGWRSTYYNSAAFQTNNSALIWRRTEDLLPRIESRLR